METPLAPTVPLNSGYDIPKIGLGTWPMNNEEAEKAIGHAIEVGYRLFDTAYNYGNEIGVGQGIATSAVERKELFVTTKLPGRHHGYDATLRSFDESMERLGLDYLDLYLIHWPLPQKDLYVESWRALIRLQDEGRVRSIGVSNFKPSHIDRLIKETDVTPALNQIQLHPAVAQVETLEYDQSHGMATQSWSPLGRGASELFSGDPTNILGELTTKEIAEKYSKTPSQIILRWHIERGAIPIPKSADPQRMRENFDIFDFSLSEEDMSVLARFDLGPSAGVDSDAHVEE